MADPAEQGEPSAVLVIRAWRPAGSGFVARLICICQMPHGTATSTVTSDPDELVAAVRAWITEFVQDTSR